MFYRSDFKTVNFKPKFSRNTLNDFRIKQKSNRNTNRMQNNLACNSSENDEENLILKTLKSFADNTTIHGIKFIGLELHWIERFKKYNFLNYEKIKFIIF